MSTSHQLISVVDFARRVNDINL